MNPFGDPRGTFALVMVNHCDDFARAMGLPMAELGRRSEEDKDRRRPDPANSIAMSGSGGDLS